MRFSVEGLLTENSEEKVLSCRQVHDELFSRIEEVTSNLTTLEIPQIAIRGSILRL